MTTLEQRAQFLQRQVNDELAKLEPYADPKPTIEKYLGDSWDYVDMQQIGGPPQIMIRSVQREKGD